MKRIIIAICLLVLSTFLLVGCSSKPSDRFQKREGIPSDFPRDRQFNRSINLTEEERQQRGNFSRGMFDEEQRQEMMEERQQIAIGACAGKNEGDACQLQARMSESEGICKFMDENLVCTMDTPDRLIR